MAPADFKLSPKPSPENGHPPFNAPFFYKDL